MSQIESRRHDPSNQRRRASGSRSEDRARMRSARRSRELEQRRAAIRSVARELLAREGISKFTMERVADEAGYARTAIYRFFSTKRDLLIDLAVESLALRGELYREIVAR